ncbi:hypothetical protein CSA37_06335 [Candidatus Fermentibacteria bacterium]|nr:MAG: hypothetical protein CSA37_06335 [Candidatus Fermentibacteria bacterium]
MNLRYKVSETFTGPLFTGNESSYRVRVPQKEMAEAVSDLVEFGGTAVFEAGTGVGKSFAYLVPALLSGQSAVISTATITLQDQLVRKDIPAVEKILGLQVSVAVLKGRCNYLCLRKADISGAVYEEGMNNRPPAELAGDSMDCLRSRCHRFTDCHYYKARNKARKASVLVVNHHLLLCGLDSGDLIPESWLLVVDEAHSLHGAASSTLGLFLGEPMVNGVIDEIALTGLAHERKAELLAKTGELSALVKEITDSGNSDGEVDIQVTEPLLQRAADNAGELKQEMSCHEELAGAATILSGLERTMLDMICTTGDNWCSFIRKSGRSPFLSCVPVNPGPLLAERLYTSFPAVLLTSATLSVGGSFKYWDALLGVPEEADRRVFHSPFDYSEQAVLALADREGTDHNDHEAVAALAWKTASEAAEILGGRTMVLFTSYRNMKLCSELAAEEPLEGIELLVQGQMDRSEILERFRNNPAAVILGTSSFWEGVDLPGELLNALIIDRIPFPSPGNPPVKARMNLYEEQGMSSFSSVMIPEAATRLKQGTGRLIRSDRDWGAVYILDRRLIASGYGKMLVRSLSPFKLTTFEGASAFLREHQLKKEGITCEGK